MYMDYTSRKIQKSNLILSIAIIALAIFVVWQQQQISQIRAAQKVLVSDASPEQKSPDISQAQSIKNSLLAMKIISGTIVSSNSSEVVVKTSLVIISAVDKFDFKKPQALPSVEKDLTIAITKDTVVSGDKLATGSSVVIYTREPVYGGGLLTAVSINVLVPPKTGGPTAQ